MTNTAETPLTPEEKKESLGELKNVLEHTNTIYAESLVSIFTDYLSEGQYFLEVKISFGESKNRLIPLTSSLAEFKAVSETNYTPHGEIDGHLTGLA